MKTVVSLGLVLLSLVSAQAQVFRPRFPAAVLQGRTGGTVDAGNRDNRQHAWIGTGGRYVYRRDPVIHTGFRGPYYRGWGDGFYGSVDFVPAYGYYGYGSGAANGLWLGALAGGILGNNSRSFHHDAWRGAAWGAGLGWLLGSIVDANRPAVAYQQPVSVGPEMPAAVAAPAPAPQQVTIINHYYGNSGTPMSAANSLFGR
jgi:hypothetical protein